MDNLVSYECFCSRESGRQEFVSVLFDICVSQDASL